jgi:hypothetical protein
MTDELCVRKVQFASAGDGYGQCSFDEQLELGDGSLETWCGRRVVPNRSLLVFVDLDSCAADNLARTPDRRLCPECAAAATAALASAT